MSKELTPMEELIDRIKTLYKKGHDDAGLRTCEQIATELLQSESTFIRKKEREAAGNGFLNGFKASGEGFNGEFPYEGNNDEIILEDLNPLRNQFLNENYPL